MLRDTAVSLIAARLGDRDDLNAQIIQEMQLAQTKLEEGEFLPWFLLSEEGTVYTTPDEDRVPLPCDFLLEHEDTTLYRVDADAVDGVVPLTKVFYEEARMIYPDAGAPLVYAITNQYFRLRPIPDAVYALQLLYYVRDTVLDSNIENRWLKHASDLLIAMTGKTMAMYVQNSAMEALFERDRIAAYSRLHTRHEARMHANMNYYMDPEG